MWVHPYEEQFLTIFGDNFPTTFGGNFKNVCNFTLKELSCELSGSFNIISDAEEGGILFLQIAVMFEMKKKNESERKHRVPEFFHKQEEKRQFNNLTIELADRESFLVKV